MVELAALGPHFPPGHIDSTTVNDKPYYEKFRNKLRGSKTSHFKASRKIENCLTIIRTPGTAPYNQRETPSVQLLLLEGKRWTMSPTLQLLGGLPEVLASISPVPLSAPGTWHSLGAWGPVGTKTVV